MSNNPEEFEKLQKLLKLKRHEQPPPGYFNSFSTRVIYGIERQQRGALAEVPWLRRFFGMLETNPFAAGIFGASICGLLISGVAWSQYHTPSEYSTSSNLSMNVADNSSAPAATPALAKAETVDSLSATLTAVDTNSSGSLFTGLGNVSVEPVSFSTQH